MTFTVVGNLVTATYGFTWLGVGEEPALIYIVDALDLKVRQQTIYCFRCLRPGPLTVVTGRGEGDGTKSTRPGVGRAGCGSSAVGSDLSQQI